ncbi:5778_t:CDS:1, partial [Dentiscutata heterogama]
LAQEIELSRETQAQEGALNRSRRNSYLTKEPTEDPVSRRKEK